MDINKIKKQVILTLKSVLSLDSSGRAEAMGFLKDCALNFGLVIPEKRVTAASHKDSDCDVPKDLSHLHTDDFGLFLSSKDEEINSDCKNSKSNASENDFGKSDFKSQSNDNPCVENTADFSGQSKNELISELTSEKANASKSEETVVQESDNTNKRVKQSARQKYIDSHSTVCISNTVDACSNGEPSSKTSQKVGPKKKRAENDFVENENEIFKCPGCSVACESKRSLFQHFTSHGKTAMTCRLCRSSFNSMLHFWRHQKVKECKLSLFKCSECGEKFKYRRHYLKHVLGHNDNNCRYCDEKFSTWVLYKNHLKEKHPDIKMERDLIPCKFCAMSFRRHLGLYNHYQVEHSKGKFVCLSCGLLLPTKEKYNQHALVHESEKLWKCKICKMKFYRRQQLLFHVAVHKSGTYRCLTCDITVTSKVDLHKHKKDGHEVKGLEPKFECEICHKSFKKRVVLKNHMATHSKEKKYYCKNCVKSFRTLDALQRHQKRKSHFEKAKIILPESKYEKVYEDKLICESCGKQYKTQRELTWHLRVHKSIYSCNECGKTFTLKVNLTKHLRLHRNKVCVVCELCGNTFNQLSALNEHILMKHSDVRNAECEICNKKFKRNSELNRHKRIHEQKRPFICFCGTAFKQSSHLQTHYKTIHEKPPERSGLIQTENFTDSTSEVFNEALVDNRKQIYANNEHTNLLTMTNMEPEQGYRNPSSYGSLHVGETIENNNYTLRYPQNEMDTINVAYEELDFAPSQPDKRELDFTSPAIDLSMVAISEVVEGDITLGGHERGMDGSVESFNKLPDDTSNMQLVNLSEHIVQEYLLNLP